MKLVLVESPTKARTLSKFLPREYRIEATYGHVRDLPKKELGVGIGKNFKPKYVIPQRVKKRVGELKNLAKGADGIILATDPDREGEAIAYHAAVLLGKLKAGSVGSNPISQLKRIVFHEITKSAVQAAIEHPRGINMDLVGAQQARRVLDRLVGYKLSPLLWKKVKRGLSAGRVQSVAVRLIVEREREREKFVPDEYWDIFVDLRKKKLEVRSGKLDVEVRSAIDEKKIKKSKNQEISHQRSDEVGSNHTSHIPHPTSEFRVKLEKINDKKVKIGSEKAAARAVTDLKSAKYKVKRIEKKEAKKTPYPPFMTSTLQRAAARVFGWSGKKTMMHAQKLYEKGLITYHRTDSLAIAKQALSSVRDFIEGEYGKKYLPEKARFFKTKSKLAQEAHEAIRPTDVKTRLSGAIADSSTRLGSQSADPIAQTGVRSAAEISRRRNKQMRTGRGDRRLYDLIWRRFVASQMSEAIFDKTKIEVAASRKNTDGTDKDRFNGSYLLVARGEMLKFDGWMKISQSQKLKSQKPEQLLPEVREGEELKFVGLDAQQKFTKPPSRYSEAGLIKKLESEGIGRPSTYAPIISTIQERNYVEKEEARFYPTPLGKSVNDFLVGSFSETVNIEFTAKMESQLDEIAKGKGKWQDVLEEFYRPFEKKLSKVEKTAEKVKVPVEKTGENCPNCKDGELVIRIGRFGKFIACDKFPKCKYSASFVEKAGINCPKCGREMVVKFTKAKKRFYGCSNYPDCDFAAWKKSQIVGKR